MKFIREDVFLQEIGDNCVSEELKNAIYNVLELGECDETTLGYIADHYKYILEKILKNYDKELAKEFIHFYHWIIQLVCLGVITTTETI